VLFAKKLGIPVGIITGEDTPMVAQRAKKLKIELVFQGVSDKASVVEELLQRFQVSWNEVAYIGDDIGDWKVLKQVGFSGAPCNAPKYIQQSVDYITTKAGGEGAFREFVEWLIDRSIGLEGVLADFS
jgi:YrbI family 3-deoxy-D-manno-octulosonate 8-phosphate phosphatase